MAGFRNLWRGERGRVGREEPDGPGGREVAGRKPAERASERPGSGGDEFRYQPEPGRRRYPEGLYSGIGRERAARDPDAARRNRPPFSARYADDEDPDRTGFEHPDLEPDHDPAAYDRDLAEGIEEPRRAREGTLPAGPYRGRGPRDYRRSDERIREDVCDRLTDHPEIDASDIEVLVAEGEVTLSGSVESRLIRRLAEDIADAVSGVVLVQNNLRIGPPGTGRDPLREEARRDEPLTADPDLAGRRRT